MACYLPLWLLYLISFWSTSVFLLDSLLNMRNNKQAQKNNDYCFGTRN